MLTEWLSWRWVFFVNVPIAIAIALLVPLYLTESERQPGRFDVAGAITSTLGMGSLVYGFIRAGQDGWADTLTLTLLRRRRRAARGLRPHRAGLGAADHPAAPARATATAAAATW